MCQELQLPFARSRLWYQLEEDEVEAESCMPLQQSVLRLRPTRDVYQQRCGRRHQAGILLDIRVSFAMGYLVQLVRLRRHRREIYCSIRCRPLQSLKPPHEIPISCPTSKSPGWHTDTIQGSDHSQPRCRSFSKCSGCSLWVKLTPT